MAHGTVEHTGKTLLVSSATITCPTRDNLVVARGLGTFNRYPATKRDFHDLLFPDSVSGRLIVRKKERHSDNRQLASRQLSSTNEQKQAAGLPTVNWDSPAASC